MSENFYPISGTNAVALTFEEEIELSKQWLRKKDHASRDTLIKNYLLFTVKQVKKMYPSLSEDDAILVAHEALVESIDRFDPYRSKLGRLSNLIPYYAKVAFRNFRRRSETVKCPIKEAAPEGGRYESLANLHRDNHGKSGSDDSEVGIFEHSETSLDSLFESADSAAVEFDIEERREIIVAELRKLPDGLRDVLVAVYYEGQNYAEIARDTKPGPISREAVRQKHNRAMALLRDSISKQEIFKR